MYEWVRTKYICLRCDSRRLGIAFRNTILNEILERRGDEEDDESSYLTTLGRGDGNEN
jgi:hypothetical protein